MFFRIITTTRNCHAELIRCQSLVCLYGLCLLYYFITHGEFGPQNYANPAPKGADYSNIKELGRILYTDYFIAFETAAVILLVAIIAAIALTFRGRKHRKAQVISKQLEANKKNRLKIVSMEASIEETENSGEQEPSTAEEKS